MPLKDSRARINRNQKGEETSHLYIYIPIFLLILTSLLFFSQLINLDIFIPKANKFDTLPISIRAGSVADYSKDIHSIVIPPINEAILNQIITEFPATGSAQDRMGTLQADLLTPVPTMTPDRSLPATNTPYFIIDGNREPSSFTNGHLSSDDFHISANNNEYISATHAGDYSPLPPNPTDKPVPTNKPKPTRNPHQP